QSRSAASALVVLSQSLAEPDRLVDMELGYRPDMAAPGYMRLVPCWKITLASGVRYADAV
ncbi:MAG: hypothetical protein LBI44_04935, partial [Oscillospiraceae bacterium]|nr:hypothetical protein [Oscillospiraceae bacterium]